ncbi:MAG: IS1595 family transposase [Rhodospirillales bacterium]|nr:IS1595 family transposase [Rhodospirillales bacterium]
MFIGAHAAPGAVIYTDEARVYQSLPNHETINHGRGEYVRDGVSTNGIESFWSMLKRGYHGTYHHMSAKHLDRYVTEFAGRHNVREADTVDQMAHMAQGMVGKRLRYRDLIA